MMSPSEFLTFADRIANEPYAGAAAYRSAVSRAYYNIYLHVRNLLRSWGITIKGGNEHLQLRIYLLQSNILEGAELARLLEGLQQSRKEADYDLLSSHSDSQQSAQLAVK